MVIQQPGLSPSFINQTPHLNSPSPSTPFLAIKSRLLIGFLMTVKANEEHREAGGPSSRKGKRRHKKSGVIQMLYETCKEVFAHGLPDVVPSAEDVGRIKSILDNMKPDDVGLSQELPFWGNMASGRAPRIKYLPIFHCPKFSIAIFCLPPSGVIPLHNHPGMTVFSKLLVGSMHIKSYDWVAAGPTTPSQSQNPSRRLAKVKRDSVLRASCETSVLYPADGGNMHCFTARTACAVLDVLGPPYSDRGGGRHCQYYNDFPCASSSADAAELPGDGEYAWLEEKPDDFFVVRAKYKGPKVAKH